ncbi:MAG: hypothetical protein WCO57_16970 [Verrucomicrobiota bacterium]
MNTETETADCCECSESFVWIRTSRTDQRPFYCPKCSIVIIERKHQAALAKTEDKLRELTPARYLATDIQNPAFNGKLWKAVHEWEPTEDRPWLGLSGVPGKCKTRCAFLKFREIVLDMTRPPSDPSHAVWTPTFRALSASRFQQVVMGQFEDSTKRDALDALHGIKTVQVLLFDDLGKQRNTPAIAGVLFEILDFRHANNLVTIWTSNTTAEGITAGMPEDFAGPLAGRIIECSKIYSLK